MSWLAWLIVAGVLGVAELLTLTLVLAMLAIAAGIAAGVAAADAPVGAQIGAFALAAVLGLAGVRPLARRHMTGPPALRTGPGKHIGQQAVAVTAVDQYGGQVRIAGDVWSARAYDAAQTIPAGATVDVMDIDGATAIVHTWESP